MDGSEGGSKVMSQSSVWLSFSRFDVCTASDTRSHLITPAIIVNQNPSVQQLLLFLIYNTTETSEVAVHIQSPHTP
jgi:hypothetical protein